MESERINGKAQHRAMRQFLKRRLTFMLAIMVIVTFMPVNIAWADELLYSEWARDDETTDFIPEGNPEDVDLDIFDELTEEGAMITLLAEPSEIGLEKGVKEVIGISLINFKPKDELEEIDNEDKISKATDSDADEEFIEREIQTEVSTPSRAVYDAAKSIGELHAEYKISESGDGQYRFFVKENGTYTFSIRYERIADFDVADGMESIEMQFTATYELDSMEEGVLFSGDVIINEVNFPDPQFRKFIATLDENKDGTLSQIELEAVKSIQFPSKDYSDNIGDLTGLGFFTALESLDCASHRIEVFDLENNVNLKNLQVIVSAVPTLDLSNNQKLESIYFSSDRLTDLELGQNDNLKKLSIVSETLEKIDLSGAAHLKEIVLSCPLLEELDLSNQKDITHVTCAGEEGVYIPGYGWAVKPVKYNLRKITFHPDATPQKIICDETRLEELTVNAYYLNHLSCANADLKSLNLLVDTYPFVGRTVLYIKGNHLSTLNAEHLTRFLHYGAWEDGGKQTISTYYMKDKQDNNYVIDLSQVVGNENLGKVSYEKSADDYIFQYDKKTGITKLNALPDNKILSYLYDINSPRGYLGMPVSMKLKQVEIKAEDVIMVNREQAKDEDYLLQLVSSQGTFELDDGSVSDLSKSQFIYEFIKDEDGVITSINTRAVMDDGWVTPIKAVTRVILNSAPMITGNHIKLYEGETYRNSDLHIQVTDDDKDVEIVIDDSHVNTGAAGTYQVKVTAKDVVGNLTEQFFYVQVIGKTHFITNPDVHVRKGAAITSQELLEHVVAAYYKPLDIPDEPWPDSNKINNNQPSVLTEVEVKTKDKVWTDKITKSIINIMAPGMILGREMAGGSTAKRSFYIHGNPVVTAYDNGLYTHQSTGTDALEQVVRTGQGIMEREAAGAYVEYVMPDGNIKKIDIASDQIRYETKQYVPLSEGNYFVKAIVDDSSVLDQAQADTLMAAAGEKTVNVVVEDKRGGSVPGGGGSVPTGPDHNSSGSTSDSTTDHSGVAESDLQNNPSSNPVVIEKNPVPAGNMGIPVFTVLPKTGDHSTGKKANIGYQATLIDGTKAFQEDEPLAGYQNSSFLYVSGKHADWETCILHIILLIVSALEGVFYFFKCRKDKRLLERLKKERE